MYKFDKTCNFSKRSISIITVFHHINHLTRRFVYSALSIRKWWANYIYKPAKNLKF